MLYEFITTYRDEIIARSRQKLTARPWPTASEEELKNGVPLFLSQLSETLRSESTARLTLSKRSGPARLVTGAS